MWCCEGNTCTPQPVQECSPCILHTQIRTLGFRVCNITSWLTESADIVAIRESEVEVRLFRSWPLAARQKNVYHRISCLLGIFWRDKQTRDNQTYNEAVSNVVHLPCSLYECVAQLVEHTPFKCMVVSSILTTLTNRTGFCSPFIGLFWLLDNPQCGTKWPSCARHSGGHMRSKSHETEIAPSHLCFLLRYYLLTQSPTKRVAFR